MSQPSRLFQLFSWPWLKSAVSTPVVNPGLWLQLQENQFTLYDPLIGVQLSAHSGYPISLRHIATPPSEAFQPLLMGQPTFFPAGWAVLRDAKSPTSIADEIHLGGVGQPPVILSRLIWASGRSAEWRVVDKGVEQTFAVSTAPQKVAMLKNFVSQRQAGVPQPLALSMTPS